VSPDTPDWHKHLGACMHAYIHTYMHTYIHQCIHAYIHTYIHTYIGAWSGSDDRVTLTGLPNRSSCDTNTEDGGGGAGQWGARGAGVGGLGRVSSSAQSESTPRRGTASAAAGAGRGGVGSGVGGGAKTPRAGSLAGAGAGASIGGVGGRASPRIITRTASNTASSKGGGWGGGTPRPHSQVYQPAKGTRISSHSLSEKHSQGLASPRAADGEGAGRRAQAMVAGAGPHSPAKGHGEVLKGDEGTWSPFFRNQWYQLRDRQFSDEIAKYMALFRQGIIAKYDMMAAADDTQRVPKKTPPTGGGSVEGVKRSHAFGNLNGGSNGTRQTPVKAFKTKTQTDMEATHKGARVAAEDEMGAEECATGGDRGEGAALAALKAADSGLYKITKGDLTEVKGFLERRAERRPPLVQTTMEAVCILLGKKPDCDSSKKLLRDSAFLQQLIDYDRDNIDPKRIKALQKYISMENFTPEEVVKVSAPDQGGGLGGGGCCGVLCMWARAMDMYSKVAKEKTRPSKDAPRRGKSGGARLAQGLSELCRPVVPCIVAAPEGHVNGVSTRPPCGPLHTQVFFLD